MNMIIKTHKALGVVYATAKLKGEEGGFIARAQTAPDAIEKVIAIIRASREAQTTV
jgi:hypothetical protein